MFYNEALFTNLSSGPKKTDPGFPGHNPPPPKKRTVGPKKVDGQTPESCPGPNFLGPNLPKAKDYDKESYLT